MNAFVDTYAFLAWLNPRDADISPFQPTSNNFAAD